MKVSEARKILKLRVNNLNHDEKEVENKKQILVDRIHKFLTMTNIGVKTLSNLYINNTKASDLLEIREDFEV